MADVRRAPRDRGQLLLVGALALAVVFVALALLLNTAIYTGNLATRDSGVDGAPAIEYASEARAAGVDAVRSVNRRNDSSGSDLTRSFGATMARWDDLASHHAAVSGHAADVDVAGTTNGTRIRQANATRSYVDASGASNWTVVTGVTDVRSLRLTVERSALSAGPAAAFRVNVTSGVGTRSAVVYDTGSGPEVRVVDGGTTTTCPAGSVTGGTIAVDVPNASVGGAPCPALGTLAETTGSVTIAYRNGGAAAGTYGMVVDEPPSALSLSGVNAGSGAGSPYWTYAIYGAELNVTYRTEKLDYAATIGVGPE